MKLISLITTGLILVQSVKAQVELIIHNSTVKSDNSIQLDVELKNVSDRKIVYINDLKFKAHRNFPFFHKETSIDANCPDENSFDSSYNYNIFLIKNKGHEFYYKTELTEYPINPKEYFKAKRKQSRAFKKKDKKKERLLVREFNKKYGNLITGVKKKSKYYFMKYERNIIEIEGLRSRRFQVQLEGPDFKNHYYFFNSAPYTLRLISGIYSKSLIPIIKKIRNLDDDVIFVEGCVVSNTTPLFLPEYSKRNK